MPSSPKSARHLPDAAHDPAAGDLGARMARLEAEVARLTQQMALLDATLRLRDPMLLRHGASDPALLADHARVEAQDHLDPDSGFHPLEYALDGAAIRWTGPGRESRLTLFVSRARPMEIMLGVHDFGGLEPDSLRLRVDGEFVPIRPDARSGWVAGPWAPRSSLAPTEIAIIVPTTTPRQDANGAERAAGIAFTHLEIGPA